MSESATYAVLLTPRGRGAVATVLVAGPRAVERVSALVCRSQGQAISLEQPGRVRLGAGCHDQGEEVVVAGDSMPTQVEIHCHGGMAAPRAICDALVAAGCESIDWQAWSEDRRRAIRFGTRHSPRWPGADRARGDDPARSVSRVAGAGSLTKFAA